MMPTVQQQSRKPRHDRVLRPRCAYAILLDRDGELVLHPPLPTPVDARTLGLKIRELREGRELSQPALERISGIPQGTLSAWERGVSAPPATRLVELAQALEVPILELLCQGEDPLRRPLPPADRKELSRLVGQMRRILGARKRKG